jgi:hypothetical protein
VYPSPAATAARPVTKSKRPYITDFDVLKSFGVFFELSVAVDATVVGGFLEPPLVLELDPIFVD